jgi:hypothetical protein
VEDTGTYKAPNADVVEWESAPESKPPAAEKLAAANELKPSGQHGDLQEMDLAATAVVVRTDNRHRIEVSNGNGVRGMARAVGNYLRLNGGAAYRLTNADHFNYPKTLVYYQAGFQDQAARLLDLLPGIQTNDHLVAAHMAREPIRVLIGHDLISPFNEQVKYDFDVDLANGNGVNGMARRLGQQLVREGFKVGRLTNADHFDYQRTLVFYRKGQSDNARIVADALPGNPDSRLVELSATGNLVQVVLGADMAI